MSKTLHKCEEIIEKRFNFALGELRGSRDLDTLKLCVALLVESMPYFNIRLFDQIDEYVDILCSMYFASPESKMDNMMSVMLNKFCPHLLPKYMSMAKSVSMIGDSVFTKKQGLGFMLAIQSYILGWLVPQMSKYPSKWTESAEWRCLKVGGPKRHLTPLSHIHDAYYNVLEQRRQEIFLKLNRVECSFRMVNCVYKNHDGTLEEWSHGDMPFNYGIIEQPRAQHKIQWKHVGLFTDDARYRNIVDPNIFLNGQCQKEKMYVLGAKVVRNGEATPLFWTNDLELLTAMKVAFRDFWIEAAKPHLERASYTSQQHDIIDDWFPYLYQRPFYPFKSRVSDDISIYSQEIDYNTALRLLLLDNTLTEEEILACRTEEIYD